MDHITKAVGVGTDMNYLSPEIIVAGVLLVATGACVGWWLQRLSRSPVRQSTPDRPLPTAQMIVMEDRLSAVSAQTTDHENLCAVKDADVAKWKQRYQVARREIEERINIMDEVESDNIDLDSALCKSIVEQEKLQMLLYQRNESLDVMNNDRVALELRLLAIKEQLDFGNRRIQELESVLPSAADATTAADNLQDSALASSPLGSEERLELLNRELIGKDRMLEQMRQELRVKDSQLDELQLELTCLSTLAKADDASKQHVSNDSSAGIVFEDDAVLVQAPTNLFSVAPQQVDRLQQITGVGDKLARTLNELGVYQFRQIAEFTATDLLWLDQQLGAFKGRIGRDNWVAQAEALALEEVDD